MLRNKPALALLAALAATALACGGGGGGGGDTDTGDGAKNDPPKAAAKLNQPARDGKFEFVVSSVKCGRASVGAAPVAQKAQGEFCVVAVSVKNIGKEAQMFDGSSQKAFDAKGTTFSNDTNAELYINEGNPTFLKEINPGNQVKGNLIFDVPKGTKLTKVELHDSAFSAGVTVTLS